MGNWGRICVGTRLEKQVDSRFFKCWTNLVMKGLRKGDGVLVVDDKVAHQASNALAREFLKTDCDTLFMIDSDALAVRPASGVLLPARLATRRDLV